MPGHGPKDYGMAVNSSMAASILGLTTDQLGVIIPHAKGYGLPIPKQPRPKTHYRWDKAGLLQYVDRFGQFDATLHALPEDWLAANKNRRTPSVAAKASVTAAASVPAVSKPAEPVVAAAKDVTEMLSTYIAGVDRRLEGMTRQLNTALQEVRALDANQVYIPAIDQLPNAVKELEQTTNQLQTSQRDTTQAINMLKQELTITRKQVRELPLLERRPLSGSSLADILLELSCRADASQL